MTNDPNRLDRMETLLEETIQVTHSNGKAIQANSAAIADTNQAIANTKQKLEGLVQVVTEFSIKTEANLGRLNDAITDITAFFK